MKKLFLSVFTVFVALSVNATELNIYASGLNATQSAGVTTIDYVLNAPATALNVKLYDGSTLIATIPVTGAANLTKGSHSGVTIDLSGVESGVYTWAMEASAASHASDIEIGKDVVAISNSDSRGMAFDDDPESPYFGTMYIASAASTGTITKVSPDFSSVTTIVSNAPTWSSGSPASPMRLALGEDGYLYVTDWSDNTPNITIVDRSNNSTSLIFNQDHFTSGTAYTSGNVAIHGSISGCCVVGVDESRVLYTIDEDVKPNDKLNILAYEIGTLPTQWEKRYSSVAFPNTDSKLSNADANLFADGHNGFWVSQDVITTSTSTPAFFHVTSAGEVDWVCPDEATPSIDANNKYTRAGLYLTSDKKLLVNIGIKRAMFWEPSFSGNTLTGVTLKQTVVTDVTNNYNVVIDPAKNVYLLGSTNMWAYASASDNVCETPARKANTITVVPNPFSRLVNSGNYGTICLPYIVASNAYSGADFFNIAGKRTNDGTVNGTPTSIVLEPVAGNLTAGQPYVFQATASTLSATFTGDVAPAGNHNGLIGSLTGTGVAEGMYLLSGNEIVLCGTGCSIAANRAYINMTSVPLYGGSQAPGIREIPLAPQSGTSFQNVEDTDSPIKFFENGQILILRGGVVYDTAGRIVRK